ncbi:MAG TPA: ABC transporter permease [Candidatus Angelobacter sp.]|nr:ABC transporter permease [Candidatus Angelobacter sp.]
MQVLIQDLRQAARMLVQSPAFAAIVILTLALGIGANTAIFSIIDGVLLRPLPYKDPQQLVSVVTILQRRKSSEGTILPVSFTKFTRVREQSHSLQSIAAYHPITLSLLTRGVSEQIHAARASANFFQLLDVQAARGRTFLPEDDQENTAMTAVITDGFWHNHFGADPNVLGTPIPIEGKTATIVGVLPASFQLPFQQPEPDVWLSHVFEDATLGFRVRFGATYLSVFGRLKPGETLTPVQSELDAINSAYGTDNPDFVDAKNCTLRITPLKDSLVGPVRVSLWALMAAVGSVLLIACANIASMLLARALSHARNTALRRALGASQMRLIRQFLTESLLLSVLGGILGVLLAMAVIGLLRWLPAGTIPRVEEIHVNIAVLAFTLLVCVVTGVVLSLLPSFHGSKSDLYKNLQEGGRSFISSRTGSRTRDLLVMAEVAMAVVLLAAAGVLIKSFINLITLDPGFDASGVMTFSLKLPQNRYPDPPQRADIFRRLQENVQAIPGVQAAGLVSALPLSGDDRNVYFCPQSLVCQGVGKDPIIAVAQVTPGYFETMRIPLLRGRTFDAHDMASSHPVAILTQSAANRYFPNQEPIGRTLAFSRDLTHPLEIVGVVGDVRFIGLNDASVDQVYLPQMQNPATLMGLVVRSNSLSATIVDAVRGKLKEINPELSFSNILSMDSMLSKSVAQPRLTTEFVSVFAALALLLAALGTYGVLAYSVTRRTREMGVRMALGAGKSAILKLVVGQGMRLVGVGIVVGIAGAFLFTRLIQSLLFGTKAADPATFIAVAVLLIIVGLGACYVPARRAARVDPVFALRSE